MVTLDAKQAQIHKLEQLILALEQLIEHLRRNELGADYIVDYTATIASARRLLSEGFEQADLDALANAVPRMIHRYAHEVPPLEPTADGGWTTPRWYDELEGPHDRALGWASALRFIGSY